MSSAAGPPRHVVVVGGGIAGLAAAYFLQERAGDAVRVTVLESAPRIGGKLALVEVAGMTLDAGAEALLARRPEAVDLVKRVGLGADLVDPATTVAGVWTRGLVRPLPRGHVFGVPTDLRAAARSGVLSPRGLARLAAERVLPRHVPAGDVSVGAYVRGRWGAEVLERLVDPLVGGVYAGRADGLSLAATAPALATPPARTSEEASAIALASSDARRMGRGGAGPSKPGGAVFAGVRGGVGRLPEAVAAAASAEILTGVTVRQLCRLPHGWRLVTGSAAHPVAIDADAVILAVPAPPAARLLADVSPVAAAELAAVEYASAAIVTLVLPAAARTRPLHGSGFLVPAVDGHLVKAATFSSAKWAWTAAVAQGGVVVRASVGRFGDVRDLAHTDEELIRMVRAELAEAVGLSGEPLGATVTRWGGALPQYAVGHLDRVVRIRAAVAGLPGLAVCGAAYDGIGIAACIASAARAAAAVLAPAPGEAE